MKWYEQSWSVFDCETTGFRKSSRIIELGVVTFERGIAVYRITGAA